MPLSRTLRSFARWNIPLALVLLNGACDSSDNAADAETDAGNAGKAGSGGTASTGGSAGNGGSSTGGAGTEAGVDGGASVSVTIGDGELRGSVVDGVNSFLGIPYAATTGGAN